MDINEFVKEAIKNEIQASFEDIANSFIAGDPDWFREQMSAVVNESVKKAIKDKSLSIINEVIKEIIENDIDVEAIASDCIGSVMETKLRNVSVDVSLNKRK